MCTIPTDLRWNTTCSGTSPAIWFFVDSTGKSYLGESEPARALLENAVASAEKALPPGHPTIDMRRRKLDDFRKALAAKA